MFSSDCGVIVEETSSRWLNGSLTEKLKRSHEADVLDVMKCDVFDKYDRHGKTDRAASEQYRSFAEKFLFNLHVDRGAWLSMLYMACNVCIIGFLFVHKESIAVFQQYYIKTSKKLKCPWTKHVSATCSFPTNCLKYEPWAKSQFKLQ